MLRTVNEAKKVQCISQSYRLLKKVIQQGRKEWGD
jgi:hypothetical protein